MPARTRARRLGGGRPAAQREHRDWLTLTALADVGPDNPVADALLAAAESVQQLSLRNQLTLLIQAGEKRLQLRDVDTRAGWARRGRAVRGCGLRIIYPFEPAGSDLGRRRTFRADARWDFAQTDLLGGAADPQTAPNPAGDPVDFAEHLAARSGSAATWSVRDQRPASRSTSDWSRSTSPSGTPIPTARHACCSPCWRS